ncbi:MAG TPA: hypothetical protein VGJ85_03405 [Candidatus Nanopelagicaceae bacterium]
MGVILTAATLSACGNSSPTKSAASTIVPSAQPSTASSSGTGVTLPVASNPIVNTSTKPGLVITYAAAENNVDPTTNSPLGDQLELTLKNTTSIPMSGIEVYYEMTDIVTKAKEGYYQKLTGIVIPPNQASTIYFDGKNQPGHFPENQFSLYRSSPNEVDFKIWVSAPGVKIAQAAAVKSKGTGEKPGA